MASPPDFLVDTHFHHRNAASRAARLRPRQSTEHPSLWQYLTSKQETSLTQNQYKAPDYRNMYALFHTWFGETANFKRLQQG